MASLNDRWVWQRVAESKWARTLLANRTILLSKYWPSTLILLLALAGSQLHSLALLFVSCWLLYLKD